MQELRRRSAGPHTGDVRGRRALLGLATLVVLATGCRGASDAKTKQVVHAAPSVKKGRLVLVGGRLGADQKAVYDAILRGRAGSGPVCVLPTASGAPTSAMEDAQAALDHSGGAGTATTIFLADEDAVRATDPQIVREIERCSGFFFTSGRALRLASLLAPGGDTTLALRAILDRYRRGAVVAATGEAVSALGRIMIAGGTSQSAFADGVTDVGDADGLFLSPGLGLFEHAILDTRLFARGRVGRLLVAVLATDSLPVGLGLDEQTALVVDGDDAQVVGRSGVVVLDARKAVKDGPYFGRGVRASLLGAGDRIDLRTLTVSVGAGKHSLSGRGAFPRIRDPFGPWGFLHAVSGLAASPRTAAQFTAQGVRLQIRESDGFSAASADTTGVAGEPAGLSAGPFLVDLLPVGR